MLIGSGTLVCAGLLLPWQGLVGSLCASPGPVPERGGDGLVPTQVAETFAVAGTKPSPPQSRQLVARDLFSASPIFDGEAGIPERVSAVARLGQDLTRDQISALYAFLKALPGPQERNLAALNLLKNNIVCRLQDQIQPPAGLTVTLIEVYRNPAQDPVARDYALQHLITWHEQGAADAPDAKARIQLVLRQAAQEKTSVAGTALLGLHRLSTGERQAMVLAGGAIDDQEISQAALRMLASADLPCASRITAIQVCAEREVAQALPAIQALAQTQESTALRISAIAALGWLGGPEQAALLQRLETEPNPALKPALQGALRRLQARLLKNPAITQNSL